MYAWYASCWYDMPGMNNIFFGISLLEFQVTNYSKTNIQTLNIHTKPSPNTNTKVKTVYMIPQKDGLVQARCLFRNYEEDKRSTSTNKQL